ncbi:hypothetical protein [Plesiomonas shigelloides]|nr:hypothetical protein [Plesiomonas shigelloides]
MQEIEQKDQGAKNAADGITKAKVTVCVMENRSGMQDTFVS